MKMSAPVQLQYYNLLQNVGLAVADNAVRWDQPANDWATFDTNEIIEAPTVLRSVATSQCLQVVPPAGTSVDVRSIDCPLLQRDQLRINATPQFRIGRDGVLPAAITVGGTQPVRTCYSAQALLSGQCIGDYVMMDGSCVSMYPPRRSSDVCPNYAPNGFANEQEAANWLRGCGLDQFTTTLESGAACNLNQQPAGTTPIFANWVPNPSPPSDAHGLSFYIVAPNGLVLTASPNTMEALWQPFSGSDTQRFYVTPVVDGTDVWLTILSVGIRPNQYYLQANVAQNVAQFKQHEVANVSQLPPTALWSLPRLVNRSGAGQLTETGLMPNSPVAFYSITPNTLTLQTNVLVTASTAVYVENVPFSITAQYCVPNASVVAIARALRANAVIYEQSIETPILASASGTAVWNRVLLQIPKTADSVALFVMTSGRLTPGPVLPTPQSLVPTPAPIPVPVPVSIPVPKGPSVVPAPTPIRATGPVAVPTIPAATTGPQGPAIEIPRPIKPPVAPAVAAPPAAPATTAPPAAPTTTAPPPAPTTTAPPAAPTTNNAAVTGNSMDPSGAGNVLFGAGWVWTWPNGALTQEGVVLVVIIVLIVVLVIIGIALAVIFVPKWKQKRNRSSTTVFDTESLLPESSKK